MGFFRIGSLSNKCKVESGCCTVENQPGMGGRWPASDTGHGMVISPSVECFSRKPQGYLLNFFPILLGINIDFTNEET